MKSTIKYLMAVLTMSAIALCLGGCQSDESEQIPENDNLMKFDFTFPGEKTGTMTRATDTSFEIADRVGVFVTGNKQAVESAGNYVTNVALDFDGTKWNPSTPLYWNEGIYDAYAYFPYEETITDVMDMPVTVATEQNSGTGYADSDFLWASKKGITASDGVVNLQFSHRMSLMMIELVKGDGYEGGLPDNAEVYIHNTMIEGTVDLNAGVVTKDKHATAKTIHARSLGNHRYAAIIMPQRLDNRVPLVEVVSYGVSYLYESKFIFRQGIQHNVQLKLSKNPDELKIQIGGEIVNWE